MATNGVRAPDPGRPASITELIAFSRADRQRTKAHPLHPCNRVTLWFRVSQLLWQTRLEFVSKFIEWRSMRVYGCQLGASAEVGPGLFLPHPTGIVLGGRTRLGRSVTLAQNVTLGSAKRTAQGRDQPTVGDGVWVGAGAVVVGGLTVGSDAVIGANAVVATDVPEGATVRAPRSSVGDGTSAPR